MSIASSTDNNKVTHDIAMHLIGISSRDDIIKIRQYIAATAESLGADKEKSADLITAAHEYATNIYEHGYKEQPCQIGLSVEFTDGTLAVTLVDDAPPFDPTKAAKPDTDAPLALRGDGGMGILMMHEFVDRITYRRTEDERNLIILEIGGHHGN